MSAASQREHHEDHDDLVEAYLHTVITGQPSALVDQALRPASRPDRRPPPEERRPTSIFHRLLDSVTILAIIILVPAGLTLWLPNFRLAPTRFFPASNLFHQKTNPDIFRFPCRLQASSPEHQHTFSDSLSGIATIHSIDTTAFLQSQNATHNAFAASSSHQVTLNSALLELTSRIYSQLHHKKKPNVTCHSLDCNQSSPLLQSLQSIILPSSSSSSFPTTLNNHTQLLSNTIATIETTINEAFTVKSSLADARHDLLNGSGWFEMPGYIRRALGKPEKKNKKKKKQKQENNMHGDEEEEKEEQEDEREAQTMGKGQGNRPTQQEQELALLDRYQEAMRELTGLIWGLGQAKQCLEGEVGRVEALAKGLEDVASAFAAAASWGNGAQDEAAAVEMMDREQQQYRDALIPAAEQSFLRVMKQAIEDVDRIEQFQAFYNRL